MIKHFYHLYAGPGARWEPVLDFHLGALERSGGTWEITAGIVGPAAERTLARKLLPPGTQFTEADTGWEQVTLRALHAWAKTAAPETPVLYAHSKGVTHWDYEHDGEARIEEAWRSSMTRHLVSGWRHCLELLEDRDLVGCHWLTPDEYPVIETPIFGGNFWWGRAGYLAALPPPSSATRFHAEGWAGQANPRIADLNPGWPRLGVNI